MIKVSVCIATWCRKEKLAQIVDLLENQTFSADEYEIIVVDSNSPDHTDEMMNDYCHKYSNVVYIPDATNVLAVKRNVGVDVARGEIIVFMDDDVFPTSTFVEAHYNANIQNVDTFYCGQIRFPEHLVKQSNYYRFRNEQHLDKQDEGIDLPFNKIVVMNLSFPKELYYRVGGVNEEFVGYGSEDIEFGWRIQKAGYRLHYLPEAFATHFEDSSTIKEYGNKLYKSGLYGNRTLKRVAPEVNNALAGRAQPIKYLLSLNIISKLMEVYLLLTDKYHVFYSYYLYKAYLISKSYKGRRDQKKVDPLSESSAKSGW